MYQAKFTERLSDEQLQAALVAHSARAQRMETLRQYYVGKNPAILGREAIEGGPDNRVPITLARRTIKTVTGYMFKPGLIKLVGSGMEKIAQTLRDNREASKTSRLGRYMSIYGEALELHYTDAKGKPVFAVPEPAEIMPVYDYSIEPQLVAAIRVVMIGKAKKVEVWYADLVDYMDLTDKGLVMVESKEHAYKTVPVSVYLNNDDRMGDFEAQVPLLDAYDVLISDSLNELDRFAHAYLILKGMMMDKVTAEDVKRKRLFEIVEEAEISFLTKEINDTFLENLKKTIKDLVHELTQIPDLTDAKYAAESSGKALRYKLIDFENLCSDKEIGFREGLIRRVELLCTILNFTDPTLSNDFDVKFSRNFPADVAEVAEWAIKLMPIVSRRTLLDQVPFVKSADDELKRLAEEKAADRASLDPYNQDENA